MPHSIFKNIINSGTEIQKSLFAIRKIRLLNILFLISIVNAELYCVLYLFINPVLFVPIIISSNFFVLLWFLGILLNRLNKVEIARHLLCITLTLVTFIATFKLIGSVSQVHFYFILFSIAPLLVWTLKQLKQIFFYFIINTSLYIYAECIWDNSNIMIVFPHQSAIYVSIFTVVGTFLSLLAALWFNIKNIEENETQLELQSTQLETMISQLHLQNAEIINQKKSLDELNADLLFKNESLLALNATKDKFFSIISHDLRNPFNILVGFSELLIGDLSNIEQDKIQEIYKHIHNTSTNTYRLLENLLTWSMNQSGTLKFNPEKCNIEHIILDSIHVSKLLAVNKNIELTLHIEPSIMVNIDINMFKTIIRNLLNNAIKYSNRNSIVTITATKKDDKAIISISDSGIGISDTLIHSIFDITSSISKLGTEHEKGTGIGLILCKEFVEKHGGTIWVESYEGKGSTFSFSLPLFH